MLHLPMDERIRIEGELAGFADLTSCGVLYNYTVSRKTTRTRRWRIYLEDFNANLRK
jgi:hypothetical protein